MISGKFGFRFGVFKGAVLQDRAALVQAATSMFDLQILTLILVCQHPWEPPQVLRARHNTFAFHRKTDLKQERAGSHTPTRSLGARERRARRVWNNTLRT